MSQHPADAPPRAAMPARAARRLLELEAETRFALDHGRIASEGPPDLAPGPLIFMAGGRLWLAEALESSLAQALNLLARDEPPLIPGRPPAGAERYLSLLAAYGPIRAHGGLSFLLPQALPAPGDAQTVASDSAAAQAIEGRLARDGMPPELLALNFRSVADLWPPYCLVMEDGRIAALAFTARLGARGAELGLVTLPEARGRGLAAQAVAGWSALAELRGRTLFYSTSAGNRASMRVAAKLGLPFIGPTWEISRS